MKKIILMVILAMSVVGCELLSPKNEVNTTREDLKEV